MILILSSKFDQSTNSVIDWLNYMGEDVVRLNKDDNRYIFNALDSKGIYFTDTISNKVVNLLEAKSCWWRRTGVGFRHFSPTQPTLVEKDSIDISHFTTPQNVTLSKEYQRLREYIYYQIYNNCSINIGAPAFDFNRLIVFEMAKGCDLLIPEYRILTNSTLLEDCKKKWGNIVTKAISNGLYDDINGYRYYTYTELLNETSMLFNDNICFFPSLITKMVEKEYEIRSFYLAGHFFSMAIFSQSCEQTKIDFRKYEDNRVEPYKLPENIERKTKNLFNKLNFNCGSVDFIVDKKGNYIFLEINPVGQFGMTDFPCNYNLDHIIANYLRNGEIIKDRT